MNTNTKYEIEGTAVFMWSKEDSECICCSDKNTPHRHNFNRHIKFDNKKSKIFGREVTSMLEVQSEALHVLKDVEGKRVRVTIEIIEENE